MNTHLNYEVSVICQAMVDQNIDFNIDACEVESLANLRAYADLASDPDVSDDTVALIMPGWYAEDIGATDHFPDEDESEDAAQRFVDSGDWDEGNSTTWVHVYTFRTGYCLDEDGDLVTLCIDRGRHTITIHPEEPECLDGRDHDWQSPYKLLGGLKENPGVWGNGGGIIAHEVCANCGARMTYDTWAQDPETGEQGLTQVTYKEATSETHEWSLAGAMEALEDLADLYSYGDPEEAFVAELEREMDKGEISRADAWERIKIFRAKEEGDIPSSAWEQVDSYHVLSSWTPQFGARLIPTQVEIAEHEGYWFGRESDDAGGSDEAPTLPIAESREKAEKWAFNWVETHDEAPDPDELVEKILDAGWFSDRVTCDRVMEIANFIIDSRCAVWVSDEGSTHLNIGGNTIRIEGWDKSIVLTPVDTLEQALSSILDEITSRDWY
jgi:hypothetical protein